MSSLLTVLIGVITLWSIAVITPGPNFLVVAHTSAAQGKKQALAVVLGIATGTLIWGMAGFLGVTLLFVAVPWLFVALKVGGGVYLLYMGWRMIKASVNPVKMVLVEDAPAITPGMRENAVRGLLTNMANPKSAIFVSSLFASVLPPHPSLSLGAIAIALMVSISLSWYALVVTLFSSPRFARAYLRGKRWIERGAGTIFLGFGLHLISSR
ncbi:LysE family transporter [Pokkaliibacter sp. MBI-7]|uniref:LysE family transporter n=1 Tax=Pokkaliibacter sp. MBI-7 TaxID=3040600 RepID=UPI00244B6850|nr:LysE family transporter [Pokkaliibacter sp. MBI-7]MDH2434597.1 LysE family transporter [Pokkaliibacter sp. MBI-7]